MGLTSKINTQACLKENGLDRLEAKNDSTGEGPLLEPGQHFHDTNYTPDTESGDSRLSDSTEFFR